MCDVEVQSKHFKLIWLICLQNVSKVPNALLHCLLPLKTFLFLKTEYMEE